MERRIRALTSSWRYILKGLRLAFAYAELVISPEDKIKRKGPSASARLPLRHLSQIFIMTSIAASQPLRAEPVQGH